MKFAVIHFDLGFRGMSTYHQMFISEHTCLGFHF